VDAATTPTSLTVAHPNGTFTSTLNTEPVRMQSGGAWTDISTDLMRTTVDGVSVLKPEKAPVDITVSTGGTSEIASLGDKDGHSISQSWPFGTLPAPVVEGNSATYRQVLPGVDLIQMVHKTGISQVLKIETAEAARDPRVAQMRIFLDSEKLSVEQGAGGDLSAKGTDSGEVELRNTGGRWWDSSAEGATAEAPGGNGIAQPFSLKLGTEAGQQSQIFGMETILGAQGLTYPVYVDPDWTFSSPDWLYVDTAFPTTSYWNGQFAGAEGHVGYLPPKWAPYPYVSHLTRTYFQFNASAVAGKDILNAKMSTWESWSASCTPTHVGSFITDGVNQSTTWNVQPNYNTKFQTDMGAVAKGWSASCPQGSVGFDLMAGQHLLETRSTWTIMLAAGDETNELGWKKFSKDASITVTYNTTPNTPVFQELSRGKWFGTPWAPGSNMYTRDLQPRYTVQASDPDGYTGDNITVQMSLWRPNGSQVGDNYNVLTDAGGSNVTWQGPALTDGAYTLRALTKDRWGGVSGVMAVVFIVDTTAPSATNIKPLDGIAGKTSPATFDGVIGVTRFSFTLSSTVAANPADGYIFSTVKGPAEDTIPVDLINCSQTRVKEYVAVCPGYGQSTDVTISPLDGTTTLTVWAFDHAGNVSQPILGAPTHFTITVPTREETLPTVQPEFLDLELSGSASWIPESDSTNVCDYNNSFSAAVAPLQGQYVLNFPNTSAKAESKVMPGTSIKRAVDTAESYSVSAWVCPTETTGLQPVISQLTNSTTSSGALQLDAGHAQLMSRVGATTQEKVTTDAVLVPKKWTFVSAVFDRINAQLRISTYRENEVNTWVIAAAPPAASSRVSSGESQPARLGLGFTGQIFRPVMTQGVLGATGFTKIQDNYGTTKGLLK